MEEWNNGMMERQCVNGLEVTGYKLRVNLLLLAPHDFRLHLLIGTR